MSSPSPSAGSATKAERVLLQIRAAKNLRQLKLAVEAMWRLDAEAHEQNMADIKDLQRPKFDLNTPIC